MKLVKKYLTGNILDRLNNKQSLLDYITQRIQDTRDSAANVMHNREEAVPVLIPTSKAEAIDKNRKEMSFYNGLYVGDMATYYKAGKNKYFLDTAAQAKAQRDYVKDKIEGIKNGSYVPSIPGATCIFTYTDSYGHERAVAGNQTWLAKGKSGRPIYEEKGFRLLNPDDMLQPSDMIQTVNPASNLPFHTVMFDSYQPNSYRKIKATYSNGDTGPGSVKHNAAYGYAPNVDNAFRFVGNAADSARWTREYNELYNRLANYSIGGKLTKRKL